MSIAIDQQSRTAVLTLERLSQLTSSGIKHASFVSGRGLVRATSDEIIRKPKGGRTYIIRDRAGRRRRHVASAAGETHANMSGKLRCSLGFKAGVNQLEFGYGVQKGDAPEYAEWVEFRTGKMKARPSLQNGIKSQRRNFQNNFEREISKRLEGVGF